MKSTDSITILIFLFTAAGTLQTIAPSIAGGKSKGVNEYFTTNRLRF